LWLAKKFGKMLGFICPRVRLFKDKFDSGTKYNQKERIEKDPYVYNDGAVPGSIRTILNAMDEVSLLYKQLNTPYILFQAGVEKLVDPFAPLDLEDECQVKDKTTLYCENMWHAVMGEE
jgi:alpha-beta hydrolase superfamily lysophospholipase